MNNEYSLSFLKNELEKENSKIINDEDHRVEINYGFLFENDCRIYTPHDLNMIIPYFIIYVKKQNLIIRLYLDGIVENLGGLAQSSLNDINEQLAKTQFTGVNLEDAIWSSVQSWNPSLNYNGKNVKWKI